MYRLKRKPVLDTELLERANALPSNEDNGVTEAEAEKSAREIINAADFLAQENVALSRQVSDNPNFPWDEWQSKIASLVSDPWAYFCDIDTGLPLDSKQDSALKKARYRLFLKQHPNYSQGYIGSLATLRKWKGETVVKTAEKDNPVTLDTLFADRPKQQETMEVAKAKTSERKVHGSIRAAILAAYEGKELSTTQVIERLHVKDPKISKGTVNTTVNQLKKQGHLVETGRKDGRASIMRLTGNPPAGKPSVMRVGTGGNLNSDLRDLEEAIAALRELLPILERIQTRATKIAETKFGNATLGDVF